MSVEKGARTAFRREVSEHVKEPRDRVRRTFELVKSSAREQLRGPRKVFIGEGISRTSHGTHACGYEGEKLLYLKRESIRYREAARRTER